MSFWRTQLGPLWEPHVPNHDKGRLIGEIICPACDNILGRLYDGVDGVELTAWMRGSSPADPGSRTVGYAFFTLITDTEPADDEAAAMVCWRGHGNMRLTGADCRQAVTRYRTKGRKVRRAATQLPDLAPSPPVESTA